VIADAAFGQRAHRSWPVFDGECRRQGGPFHLQSRRSRPYTRGGRRWLWLHFPARGRTQLWHSPMTSAKAQFSRTTIVVSPRSLTMKFRPLHDRVVVRRIEADEKSKGGIIIPETAKEKPQEGEVIAAGSGARNETGKLTPLDVKVGDRVLFGKWSGTEVKIDGQDLLIMKETDLMGVITKK
jgi:chaperonin GroES